MPQKGSLKMLKEVSHVRQIAGEPRRRWFSDIFFDLIVWFSEEDEIIGFQLCYDITGNERALTWRKGSHYTHDGVDQGEARPGATGMRKETPILVKDGIFEYGKIAQKFKDESDEIETKIAALVFEKIMEYPNPKE